MMIFSLLFYTISFIGFVYGQTLSDTKKLYTEVFSNHQATVVPKSGQTQPVNVSLSFYPMTLTSFEETDETIILLGAIMMIWIDAGISWNPSSYGNLSMIALPMSEIWTPSLTLVTTVDTLEPIGGGVDNNANIYHNGVVQIFSGSTLKSKCAVDISNFPFDSQTCKFTFLAWNTLSSDVVLSVYQRSPFDLDFYSANEEWTLESYKTEAYILNGYSLYDVIITVKRQPLYYGVVILSPMTMFAILNPLVFLIPVDGRLGFSMTILLSYAICLTILTRAIPVSSNPMSFTLIIMMATIMVSGIMVVIVLLTANLHRRDKNVDMNSFWKFVATGLPWSKRKKLYKISKENETETSSTEMGESSISWADVTDSIDIFLLIVFYVIVIILYIVYFTRVL